MLALRERAARAARTSLAAAAEFMFGLTPAPHHLLWIELLEAIERGDLRRVLFICPPGHGKTVYASVLFPTRFVGRHPERHLIGVSTTDRLAALAGETVRDVIAYSPKFAETFPEVRPDRERGWSRDHGEEWMAAKLAGDDAGGAPGAGVTS